MSADLDKSLKSLKCFELRGMKITPFILAGRLSFLRVGNAQLPLDKRFTDSLPWFGRLKLERVDLAPGAAVATGQLYVLSPSASPSTSDDAAQSSTGETALVKVSIGLNRESRLRIDADCRILVAERFLTSTVAGGPGPFPPVLVVFDNYEALLTMKAGQSLKLEESYQALSPVSFIELLRGKKAQPITVTRSVTVSFDGKDVKVAHVEQ